LCSHGVHQGFPNCFLSCFQIVPNSISFLSHIVWLWFNFHVYKLYKGKGWGRWREHSGLRRNGGEREHNKACFNYMNGFGMY
jgi:hypothetical protein